MISNRKPIKKVLASCFEVIFTNNFLYNVYFKFLLILKKKTKYVFYMVIILYFLFILVFLLFQIKIQGTKDVQNALKEMGLMP